MNLYLKWIADNPNTIVCSPKMFAYLGGELMGLPLWPDPYCPEEWAYGVDDYQLCKEVTFCSPLTSI